MLNKQRQSLDNLSKHLFRLDLYFILREQITHVKKSTFNILKSRQLVARQIKEELVKMQSNYPGEIIRLKMRGNAGGEKHSDTQ